MYIKLSRVKKYSLESILWEDHTHVSRGQLPNNPDTFVTPTLSFGVITKETDKSLVLVSDIERYETGDETTYTIIFKSAIVGRKKYGEIKLSI